MRRAVVFASGAAAVAIATVLACSFPDPAFAPDTQFPDGEFVPEGGASSTSSTSSGSSSGGGNPVDGPKGDVDSGKIDPNVCLRDCDCDGDQDFEKGCGGHDGGDCDDRDTNVHSKQSFVDKDPPERDGDWNCDGTVDLEFDAGVKCPKTLVPGDTPANYTAACANEGFVAERADLRCGKGAVFIRCKWGGSQVMPACIQAGAQETRIVRCK